MPDRLSTAAIAALLTHACLVSAAPAAPNATEKQATPTTPAATPATVPASAPVPRWHATLDDVRHDEARGMWSWQVLWRVCITPPEGQAHSGWILERRTLSGEGASRRIVSPAPACHALEVARGRNPRAKGMPQREVLLAMQASQLAYQFRWRHPQGLTGPWTSPIAVATPSSGQAAQDPGELHTHAH